jgi:hypothetical protein
VEEQSAMERAEPGLGAARQPTPALCSDPTSSDRAAGTPARPDQFPQTTIEVNNLLEFVQPTAKITTKTRSVTTTGRRINANRSIAHQYYLSRGGVSADQGGQFSPRTAVIGAKGGL